MFYVLFNIGMAVIMFAAGILFYKSNGKAANFLSGYNMRSIKERKRYDEIQMCKNYGKRMLYMTIPFLFGAVIDIRFAGIGCLIAWGLWMVQFVFLLIERHRTER
ncbi:MAG: DUF3784 domain-containing protein [Clostridia bacterium]|nr:DUF3784 domain-containing protein [Clostridia bacterium]